MAETIVVHNGIAKWHWYNVVHDLETQGGLTGITINPLSVSDHGSGGQYGDNSFYFTWVHGQFLLLTMQRFSQELVDAFASVLEYRPFCRYERDGMFTIEWDKINNPARFEELQGDTAVLNLELIN